MNYAYMTAKQYKMAFELATGSDVERMKAVLSEFAHRWNWTGGESIVIDITDNYSISAQDILDIMADAIDYEELNQEGRNAYLGLKLALKRQKLLEHSDLKIDISAFLENTPVEEIHIYPEIKQRRAG